MIGIVKANKWNILLLIGNIIFFITGGIAILGALEICKCQLVVAMSDWANNLFKDDTPSLLIDGFAILWGMPVTLILFALGFHNTYAYGVKVKRILELTFNSSCIYAMFFEYASVCPISYIFIARHEYLVVMWSMVYTYIVFLSVIFFLLYHANPKRIVRLLVDCTKQEIYKSFDKTKIHDGYWQHKIDAFPISDMIAHTDYSDTSDVDYMLNSLKKVFTEDGKKQKSQTSPNYEHVVIFAWMERILHKSGASTAWEKKRTLFLFQKMWEDVFNPKKKISYYIQLFLPLLDNIEEDTWDIVFPLWEKYGKYENMLPYILLYIEFLRIERKSDLFYSSVRLMSVFTQNTETFVNECRKWEHQLAVNLWISWCFFRDNGQRLWIWGFNEFETDVIKIANGKTKEVITWAMRHYLAII